MKKVLAISEDPRAGAPLKTAFRDPGFRLKAAPGLSAAARLFREFRPDLVIMDAPAAGAQAAVDGLIKLIADSGGQYIRFTHKKRRDYLIACCPPAGRGRTKLRARPQKRGWRGR